MFDCQRSFGQSHLRGCPAVCRVAAKRSESQSGKHSKGRGLAPPFAMGLFVQNRFTRGYSIVKDRLDRATCVDVPASVELLLNAANPTISDSCNKRRRAGHRQVPEYDPRHKGRTSNFLKVCVFLCLDGANSCDRKSFHRQRGGEKRKKREIVLRTSTKLLPTLTGR